MRFEHPYNQGFPPFCQAQSLRTNKPSSTPQLLSQNSFTGTFTGTFLNALTGNPQLQIGVFTDTALVKERQYLLRLQV
jgi:hypothetical protein